MLSGKEFLGDFVLRMIDAGRGKKLKLCMPREVSPRIRLRRGGW